MSSFSLSGQIVDLVQRRIFPGTVHVEGTKIASIEETPTAEDQYILPGFIDAHIHIESSMLVPSEFARLAVLHGTVATVSDPHEIGNVLGLDGLRYMVEKSKKVPFHFLFGASPCVPATPFETAGATLTPEDIRTLFEEDQFKYLSEVMNFPGVLSQEPDMMEKIHIAQSLNKPIDGHSPGLRGEDAKKYIDAGISTDHECTSLDEALDKIQYGMKILIREGSAALNYEALHPLLQSHPDRVMFCSDDKHPNELVKGHINLLVKRSIQLGYDLFDVLRAACSHPNEHYDLGIGQLQEGDPADFIVVDNLKEFDIRSTYINGKLVASEGKSFIERTPIEAINRFHCTPKKEEDFELPATEEHIHVIQILPGELITKKQIQKAKVVDGKYVTDASRDLLKMAVVNRYQDTPPAMAFVQGMGLKEGAVASSVAHDSHNIVVVGVDDASLCEAVNEIIAAKGGIAMTKNHQVSLLPLPIAGLMSDQEGAEVASNYATLKEASLNLGSSLPDPFMALSFLALLVIPSIKLSDKGLFDVDAFKFIPLNAG